MKSIIAAALIAASALALSSCNGTITSPYTGNTYDFSVKPVVKPSK